MLSCFLVKQFTIPSQFGNFNQIGYQLQKEERQDLIDTLQKLHYLSIENGADFEEIYYYVLISPTQHLSGGVYPGDLNKKRR